MSNVYVILSLNMHKVVNEYFSQCECMHNSYQLCALDGQGFWYVASGPMVRSSYKAGDRILHQIHDWIRSGRFFTASCLLMSIFFPLTYNIIKSSLPVYCFSDNYLGLWSISFSSFLKWPEPCSPTSISWYFQQGHSRFNSSPLTVIIKNKNKKLLF